MFELQADKMITDLIIFDMSNGSIRTDILKHPDPALGSINKICLAYESATAQNKTFQDSSNNQQSNGEISAVKKNPN